MQNLIDPERIITLVSLSNFERQQRILQILNLQERISVVDVCEMFSISEATARRDLDVLSEKNYIQRDHGGAISLKFAFSESPIIQREKIQAEEKKRIGKATARLVLNGETIFLGYGSTVLEVAKELRYHKDLKVVTNSLPVLNLLSCFNDVAIISLGGILRESELSFIGHITEQAIKEIRVDKVIIGVQAIHLEHGLTNDYLPETMTDRAILKSGEEVIVVADHTKFNIVSTAFLAPIQSIQKLVTDEGTSSEFITSLETLGIEVIVV